MRNLSEKLRTMLLENGMRKFWFAGTAGYWHPRDSVPGSARIPKKRDHAGEISMHL